MHAREWALVLFTLLSQAAVGALLTLLVLDVWRSRRGELAALDRRGSLAAVLAVYVTGFVIAPFHLATPLEAPRALVNFASSWLSREIVFGGLFALLLLLLVVLEWRSLGSAGLRRLVAVATAVSGVLFLYCQIKIYMLPAQPAWNNSATPASFVASALRLGVLGVAVWLVTRRYHEEEGARPLRALALVGIAVLMLEIFVLPMQLGSLLADGSIAATTSADQLTGQYGVLLGLRLLLLLAGVSALGLLLAGARRVPALVYGSFAAVLLSEIFGRYLFYATQVRVGI